MDHAAAKKVIKLDEHVLLELPLNTATLHEFGLDLLAQAPVVSKT